MTILDLSTSREESVLSQDKIHKMFIIHVLIFILIILLLISFDVLLGEAINIWATIDNKSKVTIKGTRASLTEVANTCNTSQS